jgi:hypothetical protein
MCSSITQLLSSAKGVRVFAASMLVAVLAMSACDGDGPPGGSSGEVIGNGDDGGLTHQGPSPFLACLACASERCPDVQACFDDDACAAGIRCSMMECLGGSLEAACVAACFGNDPTAAALKLGALACASTLCAAECSEVLGGASP